MDIFWEQTMWSANIVMYFMCTLAHSFNIIYSWYTFPVRHNHRQFIERIINVKLVHSAPIVTSPTWVIVVMFTFDRRNGIIYGNNSLITSCPINVKLNGVKYKLHFRLMQVRHMLMSLPIVPDEPVIYRTC